MPLQQRADGGDRKAACRLAMELLRCQQIAWWSELEANQGSDHESEFEREGNLAAADHSAAGKIWRIERLQDCQAVPEHLQSRGAEYLVQAARAGEPEAMLRYGDGQHWRPDGRGMLSDPGFDAWRREAPGMVRRAFEAGYPDAAFHLSMAYQTDFGFMPSLVPDDPVRALAYLHLHSRLLGGQGPRGSLGLDAAGQQQARDLAIQMHRQYFNGRIYRQPLMDAAYFTHSPRSGASDFCSDPLPPP